MIEPSFISAIGTPLLSDESLDRDGLAAHLADQWSAGITGVLVAGTMGMLPAFSKRLNHRGIPGHYAARPFRGVPEEQLDELLNDPVVARLNEPVVVPG
jgi:hypothetical protein